MNGNKECHSIISIVSELIDSDALLSGQWWEYAKQRFIEAKSKSYFQNTKVVIEDDPIVEEDPNFDSMRYSRADDTIKVKRSFFDTADQEQLTGGLLREITRRYAWRDLDRHGIPDIIAMQSEQREPTFDTGFNAKSLAYFSRQAELEFTERGFLNQWVYINNKAHDAEGYYLVTQGKSEQQIAERLASECRIGNPEYDKFVEEWANKAATDIVRGAESADRNKAEDEARKARKEKREAEVKHRKQTKTDAKEAKRILVQKNKVPVIEDFLDDWKSRATADYTKEYKSYQAFKQDIKDREAKYEAHCRENGINPHGANSELREQFGIDYHTVSDREQFYSTVIRHCARTQDWKKALDDILVREQENKRYDLYYRVTEVTGTVVDASNLFIGDKGNINGKIVGEKATANVWTEWGSFGYRAREKGGQIAHFRVRVEETDGHQG